MVYITIVALPIATDITITWLRGSEKSLYLQLWVFCGYQIWVQIQFLERISLPHFYVSDSSEKPLYLQL